MAERSGCRHNRRGGKRGGRRGGDSASCGSSGAAVALSSRIGAAERRGDTICDRKGSQMTFDLIVSPAEWVRQVSRVENSPTILIKPAKSANQGLIMHQMPTHGVSRSRAAGSGSMVRVWPIEVRAAAKPSALAAALLLYCLVCSPRRSQINFYLFPLRSCGPFAPFRPTETNNGIFRIKKQNEKFSKDSNRRTQWGSRAIHWKSGDFFPPSGRRPQKSEPCKGRLSMSHSIKTISRCIICCRCPCCPILLDCGPELQVNK
jgi:hypothetical protein